MTRRFIDLQHDANGYNDLDGYPRTKSDRGGPTAHPNSSLSDLVP